MTKIHHSRQIGFPKMRNPLTQFYLTKKIQWSFQKKVISRYYPKSWRFALCDIVLGALSFFFNPYRVCRKKGTTYGETPIESFHRIAEFCSLSREDVFLELGSGRGKGAFWISQFIGCKTIGVDNVSIFIWAARMVQSLFRVKNLSFIRSEMLNVDFSKISFVYLYSTCMEEENLALLKEKMGEMASKSRVLTISAPLPGPAPIFRLAGSFAISFPWGDTEAYIHERL